MSARAIAEAARVLDLVDIDDHRIVDERRAAGMLGLTIRFGRMPDDLMAIPSHARISSFVQPRTATAHIIVQQEPAAMRFAIARELGRWVLHRGRLDVPGYDKVSVRSGFEMSPEQMEAEVFASHLLAPEHRMRRWRRRGVVGPARLGRILGVPPTIVQRRIAA